ncbi:bifunctional glutamate N-acetyltransferase/amino-acid acetyltransferase ArgJ [uncultured Shimia sp.]|uniref:bifunctional glutamate N-acetyltransferase/amino-acid acetyltransferase ArgJ n=1 Tax=uncultured Shimia sp. TaxID=573152 RepID=UPI0025E1DD73|nr:bifunctional glutamate N-acetyltransferase/amino-acid acetyltransferase ArgJ [uncultured Shimia sp.]
MAKIDHVSPLAPASFPELPFVKGVSFAAVEAGVKYAGRKDVMLAVMAPGSSVAGVFTKSATRSAAVLDCQSKIGNDAPSGAAFIVNAGNANAFTGGNGERSVDAVTQAVADCVGVPISRVFSSSTGVIGEPLPHERITEKLQELRDRLSTDGIEQAAQAIRTTDTFAKGASKTIEIDGQAVVIAGIAKGSGMVAPDMATMLVYIFTDAMIDRVDLQTFVSELNEVTFNAITVDSDTSTSDTLLVAATGLAGVKVTPESKAFKSALHEVMLDLAHQVVRDGEGATKFVEVRVSGAKSPADARIHASAIANSPLVKTAIAGEDPNWGRIVMAIGKSGAAADRDKLSIRFGEILVAENGWVAPSYNEDDGATYMKNQSIVLHVDLGLGDASDTMWTCDLTHGYITINADYRS